MAMDGVSLSDMPKGGPIGPVECKKKKYIYIYKIIVCRTESLVLLCSASDYRENRPCLILSNIQVLCCFMTVTSFSLMGAMTVEQSIVLLSSASD
jgi:hypothetical protein